MGVDRLDDRARRQHPARQLGRSAGDHRGPGRGRQLRNRFADRHVAVLRDQQGAGRTRRRPADGRRLRVAGHQRSGRGRRRGRDLRIWVAGVAPLPRRRTPRSCPATSSLASTGFPWADDGTYADYCDVLRTSGDRPITVEVLRYDTSEVLRGELQRRAARARSSWHSRSPRSSKTRLPRIPSRRRPSRRRSAATSRSPTTPACLTVDVPNGVGRTSNLTVHAAKSAPGAQLIIASPSIASFDANYLTPGLFFHSPRRRCHRSTRLPRSRPDLDAVHRPSASRTTATPPTRAGTRRSASVAARAPCTSRSPR